MNLEDLRAQLSRKRDAIIRLEDECDKILQTMKEEVANEFNWNEEELEISEAWSCEKSPAGICVYNRKEDAALDECLFCGKPKERL